MAELTGDKRENEGFTAGLQTERLTWLWPWLPLPRDFEVVLS